MGKRNIGEEAMKCAADVVTACDADADACGFCYDHCPYYNCMVHKKPYGLTSKCMKPEGVECPMNDGAPECYLECGDEVVWRCEYFKEVHIDENGKVTIMEGNP